MDSENPFEGPVPDDGGDAPYEWLDEWLCEYVDGTMDPSLEAVFEQYVEANPELKAHIERLQETRDLLCECARSAEPSPDLEADLPPGLEAELPAERTPDRAPASVSATLRDRPLIAAGMVSSIAAALVVGFLAGATMTDPPSPPASSNSAPVEQTRPDADGSPLLRRTQAPTQQIPLLQRSAPASSSDSAEHPLTQTDLP